MAILRQAGWKEKGKEERKLRGKEDIRGKDTQMEAGYGPRIRGKGLSGEVLQARKEADQTGTGKEPRDWT